VAQTAGGLLVIAATIVGRQVDHDRFEDVGSLHPMIMASLAGHYSPDGTRVNEAAYCCW
jgi:hypothetical protein